MKIIKFGGSSIGEAFAIKQIICIIRNKKKQKERYAIIISAIGGITDKLVIASQYAGKNNNKYYFILDAIEIKHLILIIKIFNFYKKYFLIKRIINYINNLEIFYDSICTIRYFSKKSLDKIMNFGELISSYIINEKLNEIGFNSSWKDSRNLIRIKNQFDCTQINFNKSFLKIKKALLKDRISYIIFPGFIASINSRDPSTLGRGGSDYSASIFSTSLQSEFLEIWTDVSGIMTSHPMIVNQAISTKKLSYMESIDLCNFGSNVIYPPTLIPLMKKNIPIIIINTFSPLERGTLISKSFKKKGLITGVTCMQFMTFLFLKNRKKNYIYLKYSSEYEKLYIIVIILNDIKNILVSLDRVFNTFKKEIINPHVIFSTKTNIFAVISKKKLKKSMIILHNLFFERFYKRISLFIVGVGKVGSNLIEQFHKQKEFLLREKHLQIRIVAICSSKKMNLNIQGINFINWKKSLRLGSSMIIDIFLKKIFKFKTKNSLFIDNTASKDIANIYPEILGKRIGIITCNKIACASFFYDYKKIKAIANYFNLPFFFETNVGAGLPIIGTLNNLIQSGDKIYVIKAVLSGSLNFIFNNFKDSFIKVIKEAQKKGLTEPDPRIDLSGIDIIRKILILIRECGDSLELEDINQVALLTKSCIKAFTKKTFYQELILNEDFFIQLCLISRERKKNIRFIAEFKLGKSSVGIEYITLRHLFSQLDGKDNIILYTTNLYVNQPLLIKGAGAGSEVTASGIFSDIIKTSI